MVLVHRLCASHDGRQAFLAAQDDLLEVIVTRDLRQLPPDDGHLNHPPRLEQPAALTKVKVRKAEILQPIHYGVIVPGVGKAESDHIARKSGCITKIPRNG